MRSGVFGVDMTTAGSTEFHKGLEAQFPRACQRLKRFKPLDRESFNVIVKTCQAHPGEQYTLHAFPGLRVGDAAIPPKFIRIARGAAGIEAFREGDQGVKNLRSMKPDELMRFYYDLVIAGLMQAENELHLNEIYPPVISRRNGVGK